ncbi:MAG: TonB-dependent receptor domain-containing protein, partial [Tannerellaceae bacterium]
SHRLGGMLKYHQNERSTTQNLGEDIIRGIPYRNQGLSGRFTYGYRDRYLAEFNFGYTGSETFKKGYQFGFFPAFSVAWTIAEEDFIKNKAPWLSMLKTRYSYGEVGNDKLPVRFPYLTEIDEYPGYNFADIGQNYFIQGLHLVREAANNLGWEVAKKHNLGFDISILNNRFSANIDIFQDTREEIYMQRQHLPGMIGVNSQPWANVGKMRSKGLDGNFSYQERIGKVDVTIRGNVTYSENEVLEFDEASTSLPYQMTQGYRFRQQKGLVALGLFQDYDDIRNSPKQQFGEYLPGDIKYKDINGDGVINDLDRVAIGSTEVPSLIYGLGLSAQWNGF